MTEESDLYTHIQKFRPMAEKASGLLACDADDILHDAYILWVEYLERYTPKNDTNRHAAAYVFVRNVVADRLKRRKVETKYDESYQKDRLTPLEEVPSPEDDYLELELSEEMEKALESINPDQADAVWLHHVADVSVADIAMLKRVKVGTVLTRLHRGRKALAKALDNEWKKGVN